MTELGDPRRAQLLRQLKLLKPIELLLDLLLERLARRGLLPLTDPGPFLQQQLLRLPVGLEIERGDDLVADQHRQREIAELAFGLRYIGLEQMVVAENEIGALALDDQRIERREDMDEIRPRALARLESHRECPVLLLTGTVDGDRHELATAHTRGDQGSHRRLARRVEM